jgi:Rod binding domain-containing protein
MNASALQSVLSVGQSPVPRPDLAALPEGIPFAAMLDSESTIRDAAMKLVSSSLVLPILSSIREGGEFMQEPFKPGVVERRFGPLLDQAISDEITSSSRFGLVDSIVDQFKASMPTNTMELTA